MNPRTLLLYISIFGAYAAYAQDIHRTACNGDLARLDSLLQFQDLHVLDDRGRTLLHWAVGCDQIEVFNWLIERGIEINQVDQDSSTALFVAVQFKRDTLMDLLIALQEDNGWVQNQGSALLHRAILDQKLSYVEKLVGHGVNIETKNERGSSPLEVAIRIDAPEIAEWLKSQGADPSMVRTISAAGPYMSQEPPTKDRKVFAPNFISTEEFEYGSVFNAAGTEFYYAITKKGHARIRYTKLVNGVWTDPATILAHDQYGFNDPFLSPKEDRLYFISKRTLDGTAIKEDHDIWYVEKGSDGWSKPINAGPNINSEANEYYISFTNEGTMYFASNVNASEDFKSSDHDIYYSTFVDGAFQKPVRLGDSINTENYEADVFVAPDESYLIFCGRRPEGFGRGDLYISFKNPDGSWSQSKNLGPTVNTDGHELCPYVTADGKYLLYTSNGDIYWTNTSFLEEFRNP